MSNEVIITVKGKDEASGALDNVEKKAKGLGGTLGGALKVGAIAGGVAIVGLAGGLASCVKDAMEAEKIMAQTNAVLASTKGVSGMTSESVVDLANSLSKVIPIDDELIQSAENMLLTFTGIGKEIFPEVTEAALNMATAMGQDPVDAAKMLGKALNDPSEGLSKLTKQGVVFTEEQKAMIKQLDASGDKLGAQKIILQELETEFGGSGRAAGQTFGGQMAILGTQIGNIKESIGMALIPILTKFAGLMINTVIPGVQKLATEWLPKIRRAFEQVKEAIQPLTDALGKLFASLSNKEIALIFGAVSAAIVAGFVAIAAAAVIAFVAENAALLGIPIAIAAIAVAVALLVKHWDDIKTKTMEVWDTISDFIDEKLGFLKGIMEAAWKDMQAKLQFAWDTMKNYIDTVLNVIRDVINIVMAVLHGDWQAAWDGIKQLVTDVWDGIKTQIDATLELIKGIFSGFPSYILGLVGSWASAGASLAGALVGAIKDAIGGLAGAIGGFVGDVETAFTNLIKGGWNAMVQWADDNLKISVGGGSFMGHSLPKFSFDPDFSIFKMAQGGLTPRPGLAWVGEEGPELMALPGGTRIYSNAESKKMGSGGTIINVGVVNARSEDEARSAASNMGYALQQAMRARGVA
jgi:hypothetical protein